MINSILEFVMQPDHNLVDEEWKDTEFAGYSVSNFGRVFSHKTNKILRQYLKPHGYLEICFSQGKNSQKFLFFKKVHQLVCHAFNEGYGIDGKIQVGHQDDNKLNNFASNLYFTTQKDNTIKYYNGLKDDGKLKKNMSKEKALAIYLSTGTNSKIANEFGVRPLTVSYIKNKKRWWNKIKQFIN